MKVGALEIKESRGRYFTPAEANALLPDVRDLLERARNKGAQIQRSIDGQGSTLDAAGLEKLRQETVAFLEQIQHHGVEVKALDDGLLDFPALRNGRPVYLCWRRGEASVGWWHPMHTGFAGRKPIDNEANWEWRN